MSGPSNRQAAVSLLVGLLVVAGIGITGATIDSMTGVGGNDTIVVEDPSETTPAQQDPPGAGPGDSNQTGVGGPDDPAEGLSRCVEPLASTPGTALVVVGFIGLLAFVFRRYNFSATLLVGWTILPPLALVYFLLTNCAEGGSGPTNGGPNIPGGDLALDVAPNVPPWAMLSLVGVLLVVAVGLMYRSMGEEEVVPIEEEVDEDADLDEFAEAAGRAADRIEQHDVDVDNAVYRAWVEMTQALSVDDPDTYSAGEFASVAIDLGMAEDDVLELTRLFNEVRYGDKDAETREDRALSVLRNIESEYGTGPDDPESAGFGGDDGDDSTDDRPGQPDSDRAGDAGGNGSDVDEIDSDDSEDRE